MRRLLPLVFVAAAFAMPAPSASAACYGPGAIGACVWQDCFDPHCTVPQWDVYTYCAHPAPPACSVLMFRATIPSRG